VSSASKGTAAGYMVFVDAGGDVDSVYGKTSGKIVLYQRHHQFDRFKNMTTQFTLKSFTEKSTKPFFVSYYDN